MRWRYPGGRGRHGSCGYGFGETVGRNEETEFGLKVGDLMDPDLAGRLMDIRDVWLPDRLVSMGVIPDAETAAAIHDERIFEAFLRDCAEFVKAVAIVDDADLGDRIVVFEAAQGLLLDQRGADFPHVTRSNTGVENMLAIAAEAGIPAIEAIYVSRCYMTRHGAGPMPDERDLSGMFSIEDATNVPNPWQHSLRFGLLDLDSLSARIADDVSKAQDMDVRIHLAISCLDQVVGDIPFIAEGRVKASNVDVFVDSARVAVNAVSVSTAVGPSFIDQDLGLVVSSDDLVS